ncbi:Os09g0462301 [Oryza sativa Japonica Group]|uniref:Os09g0462301 protein n=1 Tax=Oryza sativa subsp. japonica TaxID=39947 RepID=A0A0P0XPD3_ORYSJ|nr:hypothetical protein EE612_048344 [Oryza sativa]BAT08487.1 Os09g0462301 [Oryza sativa Japonica Group]
MDQDERVHLHAVAQLLGTGPHCGVVRDVGARALAADVDAPEVGVGGQPGLLPLTRGVRGHPLERRPRVVVERGDRALRREAVLHRNDDDASPRGEPVGVTVRRGVERRAEAEAASMEEDEDGEPAPVAAGGGRREVDPRRHAVPRDDDDVLRGDPGGGVRGRRREVDPQEALDAAALVHADEVGGVVDDLVAVASSPSVGHGAGRSRTNSN